MKKQETLFELIKSLGKNEKRNFTIFLTRHKEEKNLSHWLFSKIVESQNPDDNEFKRTFIIETGSKNYTETKYILYKSLQTFLVEYHLDHFLDATIFKTIFFSEILKQKGLYEEALENLKKAEELANENHHAFLELYIHEKKKSLLNFVDRWNKDGQYKSELERQKTLIEQIQSLFYFHDKSNFIHSHIGIHGEPRSKNEIEELHEALFSDGEWEKTDDSFIHARLRKKHVESYFLAVSDQLDKSEKIMQDAIYIFEQLPKTTLNNYLDLYINANGNLSLILIRNNKLKQAFENCMKLKTILGNITDGPKNTSSKVNGHLQTIVHQLKIFCKSGLFLKNQDLIALEEEYKEIENDLPFGWDYEACYYFAYAHFIFGEYAKSKLWLNYVFEHKKTGSFFDVYVQLLYLVIRFETNDPFVENELNSIYRKLVALKKLYPLESTMINFIRKNLITETSRQARTLYLNKLSETLAEIKNDPNHRISLDVFDVQTWIDAKKNNTSMLMELMKKPANIG